MINNRIRNYDYVNKELQTQPPSPPSPSILQHKDNISQLTIYETGWSEGYYQGYEDGDEEANVLDRYIVSFFMIISLIIGLLIGIAI